MTAKLASMTGFARTDGASDVDAGMSDDFLWEIRSVNGRGLGVRLRLPTGLEGLAKALREMAARTLRGGSVHASLTVSPHLRSGMRINRPLLYTGLALVRALAESLLAAPPPRIELLLGLPGVLQSKPAAERAVFQAAQQRAIVAGFGVALERLVGARESEGARLGDAVGGLLDQFDALLVRAGDAAVGQAKVTGRG
jgi:uncharacterized protein (TIGR00255 family)